jgi:hypothetical protein
VSHRSAYYLDVTATDKTRQKLLLSSRDWETLATEYNYLEFIYDNIPRIFLVVMLYVKTTRHYQERAVLHEELLHG